MSPFTTEQHFPHHPNDIRKLLTATAGRSNTRALTLGQPWYPLHHVIVGGPFDPCPYSDRDLSVWPWLDKGWPQMTAEVKVIAGQESGRWSWAREASFPRVVVISQELCFVCLYRYFWCKWILPRISACRIQASIQNTCKINQLWVRKCA